MPTVMLSATLQASDPAAAAAWVIVLFVLPVIGYAIWFVTEWRQR